MSTLRQMVLLALKDLRLFVMDRGALGFALGFPLVFVFAFSFLIPDASLDESMELTVATAEQDGGISHAIIANLQEIPDVEVKVISPEEAADRFEDGDLAVYLLFPEDLTSKLATGQPATLQVVHEGDNPQAAALPGEVAESVARELSLNLAAIASAVDLAIARGQPPDPDTLMAAIGQLLNDPEGRSTLATIRQQPVGDLEAIPSSNIVLSGYITMFLFFAAGFGAAELIRERRQNTLDRLIAGGVSKPTILAGKWLGIGARAVVQAVVLWTVGLLAFGITMGHDPLAVIGVTAAMLVASASIAVFLSTVVKSEQSAESATVLASLTLAALGGSWWPLFIMPAWMRSLAKITPHAWANEAFNKLLVFGATGGEVLLNIGVLLLFGVVFSTLAVVRFTSSEV